MVYKLLNFEQSPHKINVRALGTFNKSPSLNHLHFPEHPRSTVPHGRNQISRWHVVSVVRAGPSIVGHRLITGQWDILLWRLSYSSLNPVFRLQGSIWSQNVLQRWKIIYQQVKLVEFCIFFPAIDAFGDDELRIVREFNERWHTQAVQIVDNQAAGPTFTETQNEAVSGPLHQQVLSCCLANYAVDKIVGPVKYNSLMSDQFEKSDKPSPASREKVQIGVSIVCGTEAFFAGQPIFIQLREISLCRQNHQLIKFIDKPGKLSMIHPVVHESGSILVVVFPPVPRII